MIQQRNRSRKYAWQLNREGRCVESARQAQAMKIEYGFDCVAVLGYLSKQ